MIFMIKSPTKLEKDLNIEMKMERLYSSSSLIDIGTGAQYVFRLQIYFVTFWNMLVHVGTFTSC